MCEIKSIWKTSTGPLFWGDVFEIALVQVVTFHNLIRFTHTFYIFYRKLYCLNFTWSGFLFRNFFSCKCVSAPNFISDFIEKNVQRKKLCYPKLYFQHSNFVQSALLLQDKKTKKKTWKLQCTHGDKRRSWNFGVSLKSNYCCRSVWFLV